MIKLSLHPLGYSCRCSNNYQLPKFLFTIAITNNNVGTYVFTLTCIAIAYCCKVKHSFFSKIDKSFEHINIANKRCKHCA